MLLLVSYMSKFQLQTYVMRVPDACAGPDAGDGDAGNFRVSYAAPPTAIACTCSRTNWSAVALIPNRLRRELWLPEPFSGQKCDKCNVS